MQCGEDVVGIRASLDGACDGFVLDRGEQATVMPACKAPKLRESGDVRGSSPNKQGEIRMDPEYSEIQLKE